MWLELNCAITELCYLWSSTTIAFAFVPFMWRGQSTPHAPRMVKAWEETWEPRTRDQPRIFNIFWPQLHTTRGKEAGSTTSRALFVWLTSQRVLLFSQNKPDQQPASSIFSRNKLAPAASQTNRMSNYFLYYCSDDIVAENCSDDEYQAAFFILLSNRKEMPGHFFWKIKMPGHWACKFLSLPINMRKYKKNQKYWTLGKEKGTQWYLMSWNNSPKTLN
jgi:hypothetical protein